MREGLWTIALTHHDYFSFTKEAYEKLESIRDFWNGKTLKTMQIPLLTDEN
jgi:hypothetical protein